MSMKKSDSRNQILNVAEEHFSAKGFDGARVKEIARDAKVNKALIYYYFESKEDILDALFEKLILDARNIINEYEIDDYSDEEALLEIIDEMLDFLESKDTILRVAFAESLKRRKYHSIVIEIGYILIGKEIEAIITEYKKLGTDFSKDSEQMIVTEFFTGIIPMLNYIVFRKDFGDYFEIEEAALRERFIRAFKNTHLAYHKNR